MKTIPLIKGVAKMKVCAIIPVAPSEPNALVEKSIKSLGALDCTGLDFEAYYVIDSSGKDYAPLFGLLPPHFHIVIRKGKRGHRAGAINDILNVAEGVDCIALFDVDSRPNADFLVECVRELTETSDAVLASGCRYVTNKVNTLTKIASIEYKFFCDIYHLFGWSRGFIQFNGVIGVSKASFLKTTGFDERCSCEDLDISEKIYLSGNRALLATTKIGEQAPTSIQDLYNQRVRWFRGAVEGFRKYLGPMSVAPVPTAVKATWLGAVTIPFFSYLFAPFILIYSREMRAESDSLSESLKILLGSAGYGCLMTLCGTVAVGQHLASRKCEWTGIARSEA
jgi:cellulose synthase/poly-beta-1,6-N-acetylglucosamine synthase-like glycosyltransferase